jgi:hypothetical protein
MEDGCETKLLSGTPQGGVISPLLSNITCRFSTIGGRISAPSLVPWCDTPTTS